MVRLYRQIFRLPQHREEGAIRENPEDLEAKARIIARAVREELENAGGLVDVHEARAILAADDSDAELVCEKCGSAVSLSDPRCRECGHRRALPRYTCTGCGSEVDPGAESCAKCGSGKARDNARR